MEVFCKKAAESQEVELSNNPVPRLSQHTVPTNLTPQMNEDDYWDVVVPKSHTAQFWYDDTKTRHADLLPVFWTSRISGESA